MPFRRSPITRLDLWGVFGSMTVFSIVRGSLIGSAHNRIYRSLSHTACVVPKIDSVVDCRVNLAKKYDGIKYVALWSIF